MDSIQIKEKVIRIITNNIQTKTVVCDNDTIESMGVDSLTFVRIIVDIENEFNIRFDDDDLIEEAFPDVNSLIKYVVQKM